MRSCVILLTKLNTPCTEGYRSGHNGADSKSVCAQAHKGSNPFPSARMRLITATDPQSVTLCGFFRRNR